MRPLPPAFQAAIDTRTAFIPEVQILASRLGGIPELFQASAGRVTFDNRRTVYGDGEVTLVVTTHPDIAPGELLTPFGTRIAIDLGITVPAGVTATVPCGRFIVDSSSADVAQADPRFPHGHQITLNLVDLSKVVTDYRFESPFTTTPGDIAVTVNEVIADRTGADPNLDSTGVVIGGRTFGLDPEEDPWAELVSLCRGFGFALYYDPAGTLQLRQVSYSGLPRAIAPASLTASFDRRPPNVIVARGEPTDPAIPPVQAVALDTDPASPTYAGIGPGSSPYGRITRFYASPQLTTLPQAQSAADSILARELAAAAAWTVTRAWDPTTDPYDVVAVDNETGPLILGVDAVTVNIGGVTQFEARELP